MQNFSLIHGSFEPIVYGLVITLGIISMAYKARSHRWAALGIEILVFIVVFKLHGGSVTGGFAATIAALICGNLLPMILFRRS